MSEPTPSSVTGDTLPATPVEAAPAPQPPIKRKPFVAPVMPQIPQAELEVP